MSDADSHRTGSRGLTSILNYILLLLIVTLLVAGLLVGTSGLVLNEQEEALRTQLDTVGNRLASDIETATRLVETAGGDEVLLRTRVPDAVAGSHYRITITSVNGDRYKLVLQSSDPEVRSVVPVRSTVPVTGSLSGGRVVIDYDSGNDQLEVDNG